MKTNTDPWEHYVLIPTPRLQRRRGWSHPAFISLAIIIVITATLLGVFYS